MKLRTLLLICFICLAVFPQLFAFLYLKNNISNQLITSFEDRLEALSLISENRINQEIKQVKDLSQLIANRTQLRLSLGQLDNTHNPEHSEHKRKISRIINDAQKGIDSLNYISVYNTMGQLVATTRLNESGLESEILLSARKHHFVQLESSEDPASLTAYHDLALDNKTVGIIKVAFTTRRIFDFTNERTGLGKTGEWAIAYRDSQGDARHLVSLKHDPNAAHKNVVKKELTNVPITIALLGKNRVLQGVDYRGKAVLASTRYFPEQDWGLVAKIDMDEIQSEIDNSIYILLLITLISITLSIIASIVLAQKIAQPIELLKNDANVIEEKGFSHPITERGFLETRELTKAFNKTITALNSANQTLLDKMVDQRTQELQLKNKVLREISIKDPLTDLYNRRYFIDRLQQEFDRAKRYHTSLILVMLDIDLFKNINDEYGHDAGDEYLKEVAVVIQQSLRGSDIPARIGGEEFCIIFPDSNIDVIKLAIERLRAEIAEMTIKYDGYTISSTCSFGIAEMDDQVTNYKILLKQADLCLYQAKNTGRNKVVSYLLSETSNDPSPAGQPVPDKHKE
jgi:diguanylate cyclase (GGDEF)-like protein